MGALYHLKQKLVDFCNVIQENVSRTDTVPSSKVVYDLKADTDADIQELNNSVANQIKWVKVPTITIGALSAGQSGYGSYSATIPSGYKATGICTVNKAHPGGGHAFYVIAAVSDGLTGTFTEYYTYGAVGTVDAARSDFNILIECVKV